MHHLLELLNQYGYIVLFISLALELAAVPFPGELLMGYCGYLVFKGELSWVWSIITAAGGAIVGITAAYFVGSTLGIRFFKKYGHYVHITPERLDRLSDWFEIYGGKLLIAAYFIPGVRHLTGYFSGIAGISYKRFAVSTYFGAILWASVFISAGKFLGPDWEKFHAYIQKYLLICGLVLIVLLAILYSYRSRKEKVNRLVRNVLGQVYSTYNSLGKLKAIVAAAALAFLGFFILLIGLIQDFLSNEFVQFDTVVINIVQIIFGSERLGFFMKVKKIIMPEAIIPMIILIVVWILLDGKNRILELKITGLLLLGGYELEILLRMLFHHLGPMNIESSSIAKYTFPDEHAFIAVVVYGFILFLFVRDSNIKWVNSLFLIAVAAACFLIGLSELYLGFAYPSDIAAGYVLGGFWLCLNIILLEIFRVLPGIGIE